MNDSINWLEQATRTIYTRHSQAAICADYISQRLANLLLERVSSETALELISLLPPNASRLVDTLRAATDSAGQASIGYQHFLDRTAFAIGCSGCVAAPSDSQGFETELNELAKKVTDTFLWAFSRDLPTDLKKRLDRELPFELRSRMDLFESRDQTPQVA